MVEPGLTTTLCAKALSSNWRKLFWNVTLSESYQPRKLTKGHFSPAWGANFHFFQKRRKLSKESSIIYKRRLLCTVTVSGGTGSFTQGQISDEKNRMVAAFVSLHPCELWLFLLLQCWPVLLASYCVVFSAGSATVQLLAVEVDEKATPPTVSRNLKCTQLQ